MSITGPISERVLRHVCGIDGLGRTKAPALSIWKNGLVDLSGEVILTSLELPPVLRPPPAEEAARAELDALSNPPFGSPGQWTRGSHRHLH